MPSDPSRSVDRGDTGARILITGWGLATPLGHSAWETFAALLAGRIIADRAYQLPDNVAPVDLVRAVGCVSFAQHAPHDPAIDLAERAAREALFMAGTPPDAGLETYLGVSKGAVHALSAAATQLSAARGVETVASGAGRASRSTYSGRSAALTPHPQADAPLAVALGPAGYLADHLRGRLGLGHVLPVIAACASSLTAIHQARMRLLHGGPHRPRRVLVITSEAALLPAFVHSYARLGVLPPLTPQLYRGLPLDAKRRGFMLAELSAAVVLERREPGAGAAGGEIELLDTAVACEGHDLIRAAPGLPALGRMARRLLGDRQISVLHPHATGTQDNDEAELQVYAKVLESSKFRVPRCGLQAGAGGVSPQLETRNPELGTPLPPELPDVYACKGALGHGLGSAGLVSLVIACLCAKTGRRPPMRWLEEPMPSPLPLRPQPPPPSDRRYREAPSTHAVFATGFGGHTAGALIRRA